MLLLLLLLLQLLLLPLLLLLLLLLRLLLVMKMVMEIVVMGTASLIYGQHTMKPNPVNLMSYFTHSSYILILKWRPS